MIFKKHSEFELPSTPLTDKVMERYGNDGPIVLPALYRFYCLKRIYGYSRAELIVKCNEKNVFPEKFEKIEHVINIYGNDFALEAEMTKELNFFFSDSVATVKFSADYYDLINNLMSKKVSAQGNAIDEQFLNRQLLCLIDIIENYTAEYSLNEKSEKSDFSQDDTEHISQNSNIHFSLKEPTRHFIPFECCKCKSKSCFDFYVQKGKRSENDTDFVIYSIVKAVDILRSSGIEAFVGFVCEKCLEEKNKGKEKYILFSVKFRFSGKKYTSYLAPTGESAKKVNTVLAFLLGANNIDDYEATSGIDLKEKKETPEIFFKTIINMLFPKYSKMNLEEIKKDIISNQNMSAVKNNEMPELKVQLTEDFDGKKITKGNICKVRVANSKKNDDHYFCDKCGSRLANGAVYCHKCGAKVNN